MYKRKSVKSKKRKKIFKLFIIIIIILFVREKINGDNLSDSSSFFNKISLGDLITDKNLKTDDFDTLRKNLKKEKDSGNNKAEWIYDNFDNLPDTMLYLAGNDPDTIDFVYNYQNGITNFEFYPGESVNLDRKTPYFLQWDNRWAYNSLGQSNVGIAGCGPTSMAMALARLTGDNSITPDKISIDANAYMDESGVSRSFFNDEASKYGYRVVDISNDKDAMIEALNYGPLIVSVTRGYFTLFGHIVIIDSYQNGKFIINDPNSIKKSQMSWSFNQIQNQIAHIWLVY
ncbi:MAG: C39 family peptidase [Anaerococcus sp.]|uniref:C39 family peptidase n=1 Tax=Anaerococcus sp. TaxID=1872515 RepID=UPI00291422B9|nr:C39 family peptidase [Anaerococcus sp.]MDU7411223.1 C39 family peptidase [Anaerococcus sp.]